MIDSLWQVTTEYHENGVNFGTAGQMIAEIKRLRTVNKELGEALGPFAKEGERLAKQFDDDECYDPDEDFPVASQEMAEAGACEDIMLSDLRKAFHAFQANCNDCAKE